MPARRCLHCEIDLPFDRTMCPACGAGLVYQPTSAPDRDWREQVEEILRLRETSEEERLVECWRLRQLLDLGIGVEQADELVRAGVDYHAIAELVRRGCPVQTAILIVS